MKDLIMRARERAHPVEIEGEEAAESGFTLIELMVVLLIIAILLAIAIPTFLGVTNTAGDRAAQSNLTNALTEAKALYEVQQSYSVNGAPYTTTQFTSQAPEFTWTTGSCASSAGNCIEYLVFNSTVSNDGQGIELVALSPKTSTCWYAFDIESTPAAGTILAGGTSPPPPAFPTAGIWYAKKATTTGTCSTINPDVADTNFKGFVTGGAGTTYANAPSIS
jgi:type IV pilus assembly protein PilA